MASDSRYAIYDLLVREREMRGEIAEYFSICRWRFSVEIDLGQGLTFCLIRGRY
jgi:hypothetical protein